MSTKLFIHPDEVEIAQFKSVSVAGGAYGKNYCVLSNKRIYHKGNRLSSVVGGGTSNGETIIDLRDVTATSYSTKRYIILLIIGILAIIGGMIAAPAGREDSLYAITALGVILVILYFLVRQKIFTICFKGDSISFRAGVMSISKMEEFSRAIHAAKRILLQFERQAPVAAKPNTTTNANPSTNAGTITRPNPAPAPSPASAPQNFTTR